MNKSLKHILSRIVYSPFGDMISPMSDLVFKHRIRSIKKQFLAEAIKEYENGSNMGDIEDYKDALKKHWVSYLEYANQYEFYKKTEEEREEYVPKLKMTYFYWRYGSGAAKSLFYNKQVFLKTFKKYVHRKWLFAPDASYEDFEQLVSNYDCIFKPCDAKKGQGIFKTCKDNYKKDRSFYDTCVKDRMLVEQCIEACEELKAFHPQSLNTIRVVTISNKQKACVFSGVFRMGVGDNVVDNSHAGGLAAQINIEEGFVETEGVDMYGNRFAIHPDSGIKIVGFKIPKWETIVETCCEAAKLTENPITGWDVVINSQGDVEFIEGNNDSDCCMLQIRYQAGVKKKLYALIKEYCGINME